MALILAGACVVATIAIAMLNYFGAGMSDNPMLNENAMSSTISVLIGGLSIAAILAASHFIKLPW